jgi:hypothetical protein
MYHELPRSARFWSFLLAIDQDLAEATHKEAYLCGGRLHCANYLRKPRGTRLQLAKVSARPSHAARAGAAQSAWPNRRRTA